MTTRLPERKSSRLTGYDYSQSGFYFITICTQDRIDRFGKIENGNMLLNDTGKMVQSVWSGLPQRFPTIKLDAFQIMPNHIHGIIKITTTTVRAANPVINPVGTPLVGVRTATHIHNAPIGTTDENTHIHNAPNTHDITFTYDTTINDDIAPDVTTVARNTMVDVAVGMGDDKMGDRCELGRGRTGTRPVPTGTDALGTTGMGSTVDEITLGNIVGAFKSIITHRYCNGVKMGLVSSFNKRLFQHRFHDHIIRNENELFRIRQYIENNPANWQKDKMNAQVHNCVNEISDHYEEEPWQV